MKSQKISIGVIGVGHLGQHHVKHYSNMKNINLLGVYDIDSVRGKKIATTYNTKYFENSDYYYSRLTAGIDFRAKNLEAFDSLEKNSLDLYASVRSLYLQDRKRKILNLDETTETMNDDDWEDIDTQ